MRHHPVPAHSDFDLFFLKMFFEHFRFVFSLPFTKNLSHSFFSCFFFFVWNSYIYIYCACARKYIERSKWTKSNSSNFDLWIFALIFVHASLISVRCVACCCNAVCGLWLWAKFGHEKKLVSIICAEKYRPHSCVLATRNDSCSNESSCAANGNNVRRTYSVIFAWIAMPQKMEIKIKYLIN